MITRGKKISLANSRSKTRKRLANIINTEDKQVPNKPMFAKDSSSWFDSLNVASTSKAAAVPTALDVPAISNNNEDQLFTESSIPPKSRTRSSHKTECSTKINNNENDDTALKSELNMYSTIKTVLGKHYFNISKRLQLDFEPSCLQNLEYCHKFHAKNGLNLNEIDSYLVTDTIHLKNEDRPKAFLKMVSDMTISNCFPGKQIILSLLELILTINKPSHRQYTTDYIIRNACSVFDNIIHKFPPCWTNILHVYKALLEEPLQIDLTSNKYDVNNGIFIVVLDMLENVLAEEGKHVYLNNSQIDDNIMESDQNMVNFFEYESRTIQKYQFEELPRDDKIERIFLILHLVIKLMESDFALWMIRHPKYTNSNMAKTNKNPIIAYMLWGLSYECGEINPLIKKIIRLFLICISIGFPQDKIDILARLVNLISHAINVSGFELKGHEIEFSITNSDNSLALEIKRGIENNIHSNVDLFLSVIDNIKAPFTKIIIIDLFLKKFNSDPGKPSMRKLFYNFRKGRWLECAQNGSRKYIFFTADSSALSKYPVYKVKGTTKPRSSEIFENDYVELQLSFLKAYLLLYRLDEIIEASNSLKTINFGESNKMKEVQELQQNDTCQQHQYDFPKLNNNIKKLQTAFVQMASTKVIHPVRDIEFNGILVNTKLVLQYREDIKFYLMLSDLIKKYKEKYGEIFQNWFNYFSF